MTETLSTLERRVYHYLLDFLAEHSFQPSVREIGKRFRIRSTKTVSDLLASLAAKGYIKREAGRSRGVTLVGVAGAPGTQPVPLYDAPPGPTAEADRFVQLDRRLVPVDECFLLKLADDALVARGFAAGDYALVNPSARAHDGDVVAARVAGRALARTIVRRGPAAALAAIGAEPERAMGGAEDVAVLGVIVGAIRVPGGTVAAPAKPAGSNGAEH